MPLLGARSAPAKFKRKHDSVKKFICQYKQMCAVYNVPGPERCKQIIDYCSMVVTCFIESLDSFVDRKWDLLEEDILTYYDTELSESWYLVSDLDKLTDRWQQEAIQNLKKFKRFEVDFLTVSNWLLRKGKIIKDEQYTQRQAMGSSGSSLSCHMSMIQSMKSNTMKWCGQDNLQHVYSWKIWCWLEG